MTIQLHRLEGFYRVALAGGYARAARQFPYPITQPAVHQQVRKLEEELGVTLFDRVAKDQMELTAAGKHLHAFCAPFFEELPAVLRSIEASSFGGTLRIDASGLALRRLMPAWLSRLRKARPDIHIELEEIQQPDIERLRLGQADLLVDYLPELPKSVEARAVAYCQIYLAVPREHPCAKRRYGPRLADFRGDPFVSYHPSLPHHAMQLAELERNGNRPSRLLAASSVDAILSFVQAGLGYSIIPWVGTQSPKAAGVVTRALKHDPKAFPIVAAWHPRSKDNPLVQAAMASISIAY